MIRRIDQAEFRAFIRAEERARNAGTTARHQPQRDITEWFIRGELVALSRGNIGDPRREYFIDQHSTSC